MATKDINFDAPGNRVLSPKKLAHVVLRTNKYEKMIGFYRDFLGATVSFQNDTISLLAYDDEHHRIAILNAPGLSEINRAACGLEHIAFAYDSVAELLLSYQQRKSLGYEPLWCVNHGPTTSMYYSDPDGNQLETLVDNFDSTEATTDFIRSKIFEENPVGSDFDPEDMIRRLRAGESEDSLKRRVERGPRSFDDIPKNVRD